MDKKLKEQEILEQFGVNPNETGIRNRGWWIVESLEDEDTGVDVKIGDLCVKARDGANNRMDVNAFKKGNCIGISYDWFDPTYLYYYYRKLTNNTNDHET